VRRVPSAADHNDDYDNARFNDDNDALEKAVRRPPGWRTRPT
jgi:hypothetical protein